MSDVTAVDTEPTKRQIAKHSLLDAGGAVVEEMEQAKGIRYVDIASGQTFDYHPSEKATTMLALFGARTLATNEASAARQRDGDSGEQMAAIRDRFALIDSGTWVDRTREGGPKVDQPLLATALVNAMIAHGKWTEADRATKHANALQKMAEDPKVITTFRQAIDGAVDREYRKLQGKTTKSADDLAALVA